MTTPPVLTPIPEAELTDEQRALYDAILDGRKPISKNTSLTAVKGELRGPFDPLLRAPKVGHAVQQLGLALRHQTDLPAAATESAILTAAIHHEAEFEWYAHANIVRTRKLISEDDIDRIRKSTQPEEADAALAWKAATAMLKMKPLDAQLVSEVTDRWGEQGLVELTCMVGHYTHLALLMHCLNITPPEPSDMRG